MLDKLHHKLLLDNTHKYGYNTSYQDGVAQWIERQFAELNAGGSSPLTVAKHKADSAFIKVLPPYFIPFHI